MGKKKSEFTDAQMVAMFKMGVFPAFNLTKNEFLILDSLDGEESWDFIDLILITDLKPSKVLKALSSLAEMDLVEYDDEITEVKITDLGIARMNYAYMDKKATKKLKKLVKSLSEEELAEFQELCDQIETEADEAECCCEEAADATPCCADEAECCCEEAADATPCCTDEAECCCEEVADATPCCTDEVECCCEPAADEAACCEAPAEEACCEEK